MKITRIISAGLLPLGVLAAAAVLAGTGIGASADAGARAGFPIAWTAALLLGLVLVAIIWQRRRADHSDDPDSPEPPAVPSAWPSGMKKEAATRRPAVARDLKPVAGTGVKTEKPAVERKPAPAVVAESAANAAMFEPEGLTWQPSAGAARTAAVPAPQSAPAPKAAAAPFLADPAARRIRDRYISARFGGIAKTGKDLEDATRVIKAARLYFEDEHNLKAVELLEMAVEQHPEVESLWLALLEILFLLRDATHFVATAEAYRGRYAQSSQWNDVTRLGDALAPGHVLFGGASSVVDPGRHYGPWPDLPNWIQAPWDLTAEVVAADFHTLMRRELDERRAAAPPAPPALAHAA